MADDLRARSDEELASLLVLRPDLARPAPADVTGLGGRLSSPASVRRALDGLDTAQLSALEAAVVAGPPAGEAAVAGLLGCGRDRARALLDDLWARALLWRGADGMHVPGPVADALGPEVAGLPPVSAKDAAALEVLDELTVAGRDAGDPVELAAAVGEADAAPVLARLAWEGPVGAFDPHGPLGPAARSLVAHGLAQAGDEPGTLALRRPVALALRRGRIARGPVVDPPTGSSPRPYGAAEVDAAGGARAADVLDALDELVRTWEANPPRVLRSGGLAARDLTRAAAVLRSTEAEAALLLHVALAATLLGDDGEPEPAWAPTPVYDEWSIRPDADRWARLADAWAAMQEAPHLVGTRPVDRGGSALKALSTDIRRLGGAARGARTDALAALQTLPPGAAAGPGDVVASVRWRRPRRPAGFVEHMTTAVLAEAEFLGVTARGALTSAGRVLAGWLASSGSAAADDGLLGQVSAATAVPDPVDHVLLQADLTAVAPGRLAPDLARLMRLVADVESRGGATVFRFTPDGARRALDAGWTVDDLLVRLAAMSRTPIPQPLSYLLADAGRRHGRTRVGSARAYVRSDDVATLDALLLRRELAPARLRRLAPTVLASSLLPGPLLDMLREEGLSPVAEDAEGGIALSTPSRHRAPRPRRTPPIHVTVVTPELAADVVAAVRAGEERRAQEERGERGPAIPWSDPAVSLSLLRRASADGSSVWLGVADAGGVATRLRFRPTRVAGGTVHGVDVGTGATRSLSVHRITGAIEDS